MYAEGAMRLLLCAAAAMACLIGSDSIPKFDNFRVVTQWDGANAPIKLAGRSERMYRTQLSRGAKERPDFAGHYHFVFWGCGSLCAAAALIDLKTGDVHPPPRPSAGTGWARWIFAGGLIDGSYMEMRL